MALSGGKKAFVSFDVSCLPANALVAGGAGRPSYDLIQLDENPARPKYGYLIFGNDPKNPGQKKVDIFTGTGAQIKKLCGDKSKGLIVGNRSLIYSNELSSAVSRYGKLTIPLNDGLATYDTVRLFELLGDDAGDLGFKLGDDGLVDTSSITFSYARSSLSEKFHNPIGWLGAVAGVGLAVSGGPVVVGGFLPAETASAKTAANTVGKTVKSIRSGDLLVRLPGLDTTVPVTGSATGGGTAATNGGLQAFGFVPEVIRTVYGPGGLRNVEVVSPARFLPPAQSTFVFDSKPIQPIMVPDTTVSASSPLSPMIAPPFYYDPQHDDGEKYEMPSGEIKGPFFAPGFDATKEAIGDRPERKKPIVDVPNRAEQIGDPVISQNTIFAPGADNQTRFVTGDSKEDPFMRRLRESANDPRWHDGEKTRGTYGFPVSLTSKVVDGGNRLAQGWSDVESRVGPFAVYRSDSHLGPFKDAIDLAVPDGTEVLAMAGGIVKEIKEDSDEWGNDPSFVPKLNFITIEDERSGEQTQYCHIGKGSVTEADLKVGDRVKRGQRIGIVGKNGWTDRDHLHVIVFRPDANQFGFKSLRIQFDLFSRFKGFLISKWSG